MYNYKRFPFQINAGCLNFLFIKNPEKKFFSNIDNKKCINHIKMISDGSCDTEDWSDDDENSALLTGINEFLKYIYI